MRCCRPYGSGMVTGVGFGIQSLSGVSIGKTHKCQVQWVWHWQDSGAAMCWHWHGGTKAWLGSHINNLELTIQITMKMHNKRSRPSASWQAGGCTNADAVAVADVT